MRIHFTCVITVIICIVVSSTVNATVWNESGDAGELPNTADVVSGSGTLTQINGTVPGPDDIDMYQILITDPNTFSATGTAGLTFGPPRMFLFNSAGYGVAGYIDSTNTGVMITDTFVSSPGIYYLAYSAGSIPGATNTGSNELWLLNPFDVERAPDGPGATLPIAGWSPMPVPYSPIGYTITLTGAAFVPEPGMLGLLIPALLGVCLRRR
ncbi:MAG: hypothetical protein Kow00105_14750 [Phycisphaeraceae bacterium]